MVLRDTLTQSGTTLHISFPYNYHNNGSGAGEGRCDFTLFTRMVHDRIFFAVIVFSKLYKEMPVTFRKNLCGMIGNVMVYF